MTQSLSLVKQCLNKMPKSGPVVTDDKRVAPPSREDMKISMEAMINHFKLYRLNLNNSL